MRAAAMLAALVLAAALIGMPLFALVGPVGSPTGSVPTSLLRPLFEAKGAEVLAPGADAQVLATYMNAVIADDTRPDYGLFKAIGMFYALPVIAVYLLFQKRLMNIYGGGTKG